MCKRTPTLPLSAPFSPFSLTFSLYHRRHSYSPFYHFPLSLPFLFPFLSRPNPQWIHSGDLMTLLKLMKVAWLSCRIGRDWLLILQPSYPSCCISSLLLRLWFSSNSQKLIFTSILSFQSRWLSSIPYGSMLRLPISCTSLRPHTFPQTLWMPMLLSTLWRFIARNRFIACLRLKRRSLRFVG